MKHVNKYAALWHRLGWRTVTALNTIDMTFFPESWSDLPESAARVCEIVEEHRRCEGSTSLVVPHVFSNGGCTTLLSTLRSKRVNFDGVIYDSAPGSHVHPIYAPFVIAASGLPRTSMAVQMLRHNGGL